MKYEERERILGRGIIRDIETEGGTQRLMGKERIKEKKIEWQEVYGSQRMREKIDRYKDRRASTPTKYKVAKVIT